MNRLVTKRGQQLVVVLFYFIFSTSFAQVVSPIRTQSVYSAGTTSGASVNNNFKLYSSIGQPIVVQSIAPSNATTEAGFMQVVNYIIIDGIAPVIYYTTQTQKINKQAPQTLTANITDNISVVSAKIYYRKMAEPAWNSADLIKTGDAYSATIQSSWFDAMGMEYYFESKDATPNTKRAPDSGSFYAHVISSLETVPSQRIGFGVKTNNYRIIATPYVIGDNAVTALFEELGTYSNTKWRMATYDNSHDLFTEYPDFTTLSRGIGYWMLVKTPVDIFVGPVETSTENRSSLYQMTLKPGWNMIGNPYPVNIDWSDVRALNNNPDLGEIKIYNGDWSNGNVILPFQGGFVYNNGDADLDIKIPFAGQTSEGGRTGNPERADISSDKWQLNLTITQNSISNKLGGFGMDPAASPLDDQFDDFNPPGFLNSPEINFPHHEHKLRGFCRDVIRTNEEASWAFQVSGETGVQAVLQWNAEFETGSNELLLFDETNLNIIDFREIEHYQFELKKDHTFKIFFGENIREALKPVFVSILAPYPNPLPGGTILTFRVALSEISFDYSVDIELFNSSGRRSGAMYKNLTPGIHEIKMDIRNNQLRSGIYYYRVKINSTGIKEVFTGKLSVL